MTREKVQERFMKDQEIKLTGSVKVAGGFHYTGDPLKMGDYYKRKATADKNIFVRGCNMWGNTVKRPDVWQEPLVVLEPTDTFYLCTRHTPQTIDEER